MLENKLHRFIVDDNNKLAFEIAHQLIQTNKAKYNPIHFFGPSGAGKSHLLLSITAHFTKQKYAIVSKTAKKFYWEYVYSLKKKEYQKFRVSYRNIQILVLENIDFLQKKASTQKELLFIIDQLTSEGQIVLTSSQLPLQKLQYFKPALASRLGSGLSIPINLISQKTAQNYYQRAANRSKLELGSDVEQLFHNKCLDANLREKIENLFLFCAESNQKLTKDLVKTCLMSHKTKLTIDIILKLVGEYYQLDDVSILFHKNCARVHKEPRYVAMCLSKELLKMNNLNVCKYFGGCSESSVRHAQKMVRKNFKDIYDYLQKKALRF